MSFKLIDILLCFNSLRANTIELLIIIFSSIGIILDILGIIFIPWKITSSIIEVLYIITLIFGVLSVIIAIIIIYYRVCRHKLNKRKTRVFIITVIIMDFICFFSLILLIVVSFAVFSDINKKHQSKIVEVIQETGETISISRVNKSIANTLEKIVAIVFISLLLIIWIILLMLWSSEYIRLIFRIDTSYKEFVINENNKQLKHPIRYGLNIIGHNKYGFPIFGKQIGNKIKIKGVKSKFDEKKIGELNFTGKYKDENGKINYSGKYFDENGKINVKYYSNSSQKSMPQEKINEKIKEKEKYMEKYFDGENVYQNYTNFENNTILNFEDNNNSINPGYEM